jgi:hypothetical protein
MHAEYCNTKERMPVSSNFSNGYGKAIAFLDYIGGKEDTIILDRQAQIRKCHWIRRSQVPREKKVTYARTAVAI